jgi:hypothetical protein
MAVLLLVLLLLLLMLLLLMPNWFSHLSYEEYSYIALVFVRHSHILSASFSRLFGFVRFFIQEYCTL